MLGGIFLHSLFNQCIIVMRLYCQWYTIFLLKGIYRAEGGMVQTAAVGVAGGGRAYMAPATPVVPLRPPMSRLGRRRSSGMDEFAAYPDPGQVESVASKTDPEIFSRTLAESWWSPAIETLQRQVHTDIQ